MMQFPDRWMRQTPIIYESQYSSVPLFRFEADEAVLQNNNHNTQNYWGEKKNKKAECLLSTHANGLDLVPVGV